MQPEEISARQAAAHQHAAAGRTYIGVISRADRNRQIEILVFKYQRPAAEPVLDDVANALAKDLRDEEAAIEENRVDAVPAAGELQGTQRDDA